MSLAKIVMGIAGMILALMMSIVASGQDFEGEHSVTLTGNVRGPVAEIVKLPLEGRVYTDVDLTINNTGGKRASITIGGSRIVLAPGSSKHVEVYDLTSLFKVEFEDGEGELQVVVKAAWKERVTPMLSLVSILVLMLSMIIAGYGLVEYMILRKL
ncbi:MAG: hypothetical protein P3X22_004435 [Thermoprotei archaeon]|nr:hypothetical protein [Thermoprotei archaeon]